MDNLYEQKQLASALRTLNKRLLIEAFDPGMSDSRPNNKQKLVLDDLGKVRYRYVVAGNRCLAKGTMVRTSKGIKPIEDLSTRDIVFDENGNLIKVRAVFNNGTKKVRSLNHRGMTFVECTNNHTFLTRNSSDKKQSKTEEQLTVEEFKRDTQIKKVCLPIEMPGKQISQAYSIGAFLGDGCSREKRLSISGTDFNILNKISKQLKSKYKRNHPKNYTYHFLSPEFSLYEQIIYDSWCKNKYAHQKTIDLEVVKGWNSESKLELLAGILDTDGSVYYKNDGTLCLSIEMQARSVIEACQYLFLELFQTQLSIHTNDRDKFVNGPTYTVRCSNTDYIKRMLKAIPTVCSSKVYKDEYDNLKARRTSEGYLGITASDSVREVETFDIHVDSDTNLYCLANGLVTHNSGKSALAARELTWILTDTHPTFVRPPEWENETFTALIGCQDLTLAAAEIWTNKIAPFLDLTEWKLNRQGNTLKSVTNIKTRAQIIFLSHSDGSEKNRRHMQGYTAHYVWLDEMPASPGILEELQARIATTKGVFIATFTPKFRSDIIRKIVDNAKAPYAKKYRLSMLDNPKVDKEAELARLSGQSQSKINTVLYGDWSTGDNGVYSFDYDKMTIDAIPNNYHAGWRHVESVDPALRSKCGYTLWAEDPNSGCWYLVRDDYIVGDAFLDPDTLFNMIQKRSAGYNIIRRITDNMAFFTSVAAKYGVSYMTPFNKNNNRKTDLIKGLQSSLSNGKIKIGRWCGVFIDEIQSCQFSEDTDRIINSSIYHTLDCAQYFCDNIPKYDPTKAVLPWQVKLYEQHKKRIEVESLLKKTNNNNNKQGRVTKPLKAWGSRSNNNNRGFKIR